MPVILGDCIEVMKRMDAESVDAIVTDPPAGISFMGKKWDHDKGGRDCWIAWMTTVAIECLRVIKPGGHALVWSIPRTSHWTAMAWENAGWEVRDKVVHIFGSGFPKSLNIGKALDAAMGAEREVIGKREHPTLIDKSRVDRQESSQFHGTNPIKDEWDITAPATDAAKEWDGWGTALKPAHEDWILLRKPVEGTIAQNVLKHGCGGINIDGCRVEYEDTQDPATNPKYRLLNNYKTRVDGEDKIGSTPFTKTKLEANVSGRFPANIILDDSEEVRALFPNTKSGAFNGHRNQLKTKNDYGNFKLQDEKGHDGDSGSAARFFYCAKASRSERGIDNKHPTVKSINLMRYLCRLITPPGGIVLDPFAGSGSTGVAAKQEGFQSILIELEQESYETANARMRNVK